jgi:isochorismate hydrolase
MSRLDRNKALLAVIDVQERLTRVIHQGEQLQRNIERLVRGCSILGVPAVLTEQYPKGLGPTTSTVKNAFDETYGEPPIQKMCFSGWACEGFAEEVKRVRRKQIIIAGIEAHVCVWQTVLDLLEDRFEVFVVADAVSSRTANNRDIALHRMISEGAKVASTEMVLFELTVNAGTEEFKKISALVK